MILESSTHAFRSVYPLVLGIVATTPELAQEQQGIIGRVLDDQHPKRDTCRVALRLLGLDALRRGSRRMLAGVHFASAFSASFAISAGSSLKPGRNVKKKVAPWPTSPFAQILPPWRCTTLCTVASPIPVPSNSSEPCKRWNAPNSFSAYAISKPAPLSET